MIDDMGRNLKFFLLLFLSRKRSRRLLSALALLLLLAAGCEKRKAPAAVLVCLEEAEGCTVENNGQQIAPGTDAVFTVSLDRGFSLTGTDYAGESELTTSGRTVTLTLREVRYPTRVRLTLSSRYAELTYDANGGALNGGSTQVSKTYDLTYHMRPNTALGTDLFVREGYTLTGWNTAPDGSGTAVGLGSRTTVSKGRLTLYAQWARWSDGADFTFLREGEEVTVTGYHGSEDTVVLPARLDGGTVTAIAAGAFSGAEIKAAVFPETLQTVEAGAFADCTLECVTLFDNIRSIGDGCFTGCSRLRTLHINAIEAPYGYTWRKESCYADKVDRLILSSGKRAVFYGGCSMWYNLDGLQMQKSLGSTYTVVNLGLNGTVSSAVQLQILEAFVREGDIFLHTPELSSHHQMFLKTDMSDSDDRLWCGIENNYDLFALVDLTRVSGAFDSLCHYLSRKDARASYAQFYQDDSGQSYLDAFGCIPFYRGRTEDKLSDTVSLDPKYIDPEAMTRLGEYYARFQAKGVRVYLSYACVNLDAVPAEQRENVEQMDTLFRAAVEEMEGVALISRLEDYLYHNSDFYDTNYHLLTQPAQENTDLWARDLTAQLERDGLL